MPFDRLIHIRHGQTDWNLAGRLQGAKDIPLNDTGRSQAARNGRTLAGHLRSLGRDPAEFAYVASPLGRARLTMEIVRRELGLPYEGYALAPALAEVSFGDYEGLTYAEIADRDPAADKALKTDKWNYLPPGGESYVMMQARVGDWLAGIPPETIVVSHGGVYRALKSLLVGQRSRELAEFVVPQDRIAIWRDGAETWI